MQKIGNNFSFTTVIYMTNNEEIGFKIEIMFSLKFMFVIILDSGR